MTLNIAVEYSVFFSVLLLSNYSLEKVIFSKFISKYCIFGKLLKSIGIFPGFMFHIEYNFVAKTAVLCPCFPDTHYEEGCHILK